MRSTKTPAIVLLVMLLPATIALAHPHPHEPSQFIRFVEDSEGNARLEVSETTYRNADGVIVELIGAVHIADAEYFDGVDAKLARFEATLYEMVKPAKAALPRRDAPERSTHVVSLLQQFMKQQLKLAFQLEAIDYHRPNFIHADLDYETFQRMQSERGESLLTLMLRSMMHEMGRDRSGDRVQPPGIMDLVNALQSPDRARDLKLLLGKQFMDMDRQIAALEGPRGSVILTERNKAAMNVLDQTIQSGKKEIAVFYGAAHLPGMEKILTGEMNFKRIGQTWRTAWDMPAPQN
jgi:hypothetical protein